MKTNYDLLSVTAPEPPKAVPESMKFITSNVPEQVRAVAYNAMFPSLSAYISNVDFEYVDNVLHETAVGEGIIGNSGVGKNYIDLMNEAILKKIRIQDKESEKKLAEWSIVNRRKGANQTRVDRPLDVAIQNPDSDISNPAFVLMLADLERAGNKRMVLNVSEVDMLDSICGSHKKLGQLIRNMTDKGKTWGQHRATVDGVTARPLLRLSVGFATTTAKALSFFRDCIHDGTLWRLGISYVQKDKSKKKFPKQGRYDEKYHARLDEYLLRLSSASGLIRVPRINKLVVELFEELSEITDLSDSEVFESMWHRSVVLGWKKGCLLYIMEGYKYDKKIEDFVRWSVYYDLWSKIHVFAQQLVEKKKVSIADVRKYGPANLLQTLPDPFSIKALEDLRESMGKERDASGLIKTWLHRKYITYDPVIQMYSKTEEYMKRNE